MTPSNSPMRYTMEKGQPVNRQTHNMAQNIKIRKTNERFEPLVESTLNFASLNKYIYTLPNTHEFPWCRSIDEYGMTVFNLLQIPHVTAELVKIRQTVEDPELQSEIDDILTFIGDLTNHEYIQFIGD